ncbi:MAG: hypothetical protein IIA88_04380 [Bacteroidetes bacterium]|nr:hypothetical protein [Bacteroidota bacterium]
MEKIRNINKYEMSEKGEEIYKKIKDKMEREHKAEFIAIDIDSGDYFLGKSLLEADRTTREKYPDNVFYVIRIGRRAVFVRR